MTMVRICKGPSHAKHSCSVLIGKSGRFSTEGLAKKWILDVSNLDTDLGTF